MLAEYLVSRLTALGNLRGEAPVRTPGHHRVDKARGTARAAGAVYWKLKYE